ncbi:hypothetical protein OIU77_011151 [Salix suchowensis]|uniref:Uncharacterized protein n=1 Tax=Salix suchowensis TaxID=1278906 RepID=A0ABQ9AAS2_9ROSI|nr:hypothetical protein OIU77_011151 [Salix suchowensis]
MPTSSLASSFVIVSFLLLSYAPLHLTSSTTTNRRILHEPFLPQDSIPPTEPPSPSPPSPPSPSPPSPIPFPTPTPNQSPFFPSYPSPPPPPSPTAFASFPANISSLILPQSTKPKPTSRKLLVVSISAVISALIVLGIIAFYYARHRRNHANFSDNKTYGGSSYSTRQYQVTANTRASSNSHKLRTSSTSSEFLYLGTLANSRRLDESSNDNTNDMSDHLKLESPELRPLPPLNRDNSRQNYGSDNFARDGNEEEEEEEFYSPRGSSGGRESSSGSRRVFSAAAAGFDAKSIGSSSSPSSSASPARSHSLSISPPVSLSPRPRSPESGSVLAAQSLPPPSLSIMDAHNGRESSSSSCASSPYASPKITLNLERNVLSSASTSPRVLNDLGRNNVIMRSPSLSPARILNNNLAQNRPSSSPSSVSTSPDRVLNDLARFNVDSPSLSSVSSSPDRVMEKTPSPKISIDLDRTVQSPSLSVASSSPERDFEKSLPTSPIVSNVLDRIEMSPSLSVAKSSFFISQNFECFGSY